MESCVGKQVLTLFYLQGDPTWLEEHSWDRLINLLINDVKVVLKTTIENAQDD